MPTKISKRKAAKIAQGSQNDATPEALLSRILDLERVNADALTKLQADDDAAEAQKAADLAKAQAAVDAASGAE